MELTQFKPRSQLVTKQTRIDRPKFPAVDAHNHLGQFGDDAIAKLPLNQLCDRLDEAGVTHYVDLDGGWGEAVLRQHLDYLAPRQERFQVFGGVDWSRWPELGDAFPEAAAKRLEVQHGWGARGLKIWKPFGLQVRDQHGLLVKVDDERLAPIWETAGQLGLPVMIHIADPVAFFDPIDETNERWEELGEHPDWAFTSPPYPPFLELVNGLKRLVLRHPGTTFIGAHVGCYAENLAWVSNLLEQAPNFYVDISGRTGELGRQPYTARKFFLRHADRILFGLDEGPSVEGYRLVYRFLESDDEYFNYNTSEVPQQGRWYAYGLYLPDDVLSQVYRGNSMHVLKI
ncbi:MAG TPA: amidohydrolase family protein [Longilinea sp.]|nr:amidohydrolase family protein [Longilinea sp.]